MKQYPKYKETGIGWLGRIPIEWEYGRLKNKVILKYGKSLSEFQRKDGAINVYGSNGVVGTHIKAVTNGETIIIGRKGSYGKLNFSKESCFPIDTTYFIDKKCTKINLKYLFYSLSQLELDCNSKDSAVPGLSREEANQKIIPYVSTSEQIQILNYLETKNLKIDKIIEKDTQLIELLKEKRTAFINQTVTRGLDPKAKLKDSGIDWIGKIPEKWEIRKLSHIAKKICVGFVGSIENHYTEKDGGVLLLKTGNVGYGKILLDDASYVTKEFHLANKKSQLKPGDLVIARHGESGRSAVIPPEIKEANCLNVVLLKSSLTMNDKYYSYLLNSHAVQEHLQAIQGGSVQGVINTEDISSLKVTYPPIQEQIQIAMYLDSKTLELDIIIKKVQKRIALLEEYMKSLINNIITGKIDVME